MRQRRSGPGSPDHIRTSFPDQFFAVTNLRADVHNRCILQFRQISWPQKNAAANRADITGGEMDSLDPDDHDPESFDCGPDGLLGVARAEIATPYGE